MSLKSDNRKTQKEQLKALQNSQEIFEKILQVVEKVDKANERITENLLKQAEAEEKLQKVKSDNQKITDADLKSAKDFLKKKEEILKLDLKMAASKSDQQGLEKTKKDLIDVYEKQYKGLTNKEKRELRAGAEDKYKSRMEELSSMKDKNGQIMVEDENGEQRDIAKALEAQADAERTASLKLQTEPLNLGSAFSDAIKSGDFVGSMTESISGGLAGSGVLLGISAIVKTVKAVAAVVSALNEKIGESVTEITSMLSSENVKKFDSRLYGIMTGVNGLNANFITFGEDALALVGENNSLISSKELIENIVKLGNMGIAYNLEQRALWDTMSDKIVSTFEVTNDTLLQLIKVQQQELTDVYMGVEAAITRTLNSLFNDTQFLNESYDAVLSNLATALANTDVSTGSEILYQVEKWLGSLSSLGLSSNAASSISQALGQVITGDIDSLSEQGRTLFAMAAANSGISYADLLVNGIQSGDETNKLLQSMFKVLRNIYTSSEGNNVLLQKWGDIFSLELSDWHAIENLTDLQYKTLSALNLGLEDFASEVTYITDNLVAERTTYAERIQNLVDNIYFSAGWNISTDVDKYATWYTSEVIEKVGGILGVSGLASAISGVAKLFTSADDMINIIGTLFKTIDKDQVTAAQSLASFAGNQNYISEVFSDYLLGGRYIDYSNIDKQTFYTQENAGNIITLLNGNSTRSDYLNNLLSKNENISTFSGDYLGVDVSSIPSFTSVTNAEDESLETEAEQLAVTQEISKKLDAGIAVTITNPSSTEAAALQNWYIQHYGATSVSDTDLYTQGVSSAKNGV